MSKFIVDKTITLMKQKKINIKTSKILVLGYSFKEKLFRSKKFKSGRYD